MSIERILYSLREIKSRRVQRTSADELLSLREACRLLGADLPQCADPEKKLSMICCFEGVFLKDCLYVQDERNEDGSARNAMRRGAYAILSNHQIDDYPCIIVDDVFGAVNHLLQPLAKKLHIPTTVITGSVGKTTTKNFINCVYSSYANTFCNITNGNSFGYVGFELQRFDRKAKLFVQEVNESDPHNTLNASEVLKPEIAVITNIDKSHIGELGGEENIKRAICEITAGMDETGIVIINADEPNSKGLTFQQRIVSVGIKDTSADCVASNIVSASADRMEFDVSYDGETAHLIIPVTGTHNVYDAMMAFVAGRLSSIPTETIKKGLQKYRPLGFRQNTYRSGSNTIYADCYNASAKSIKSALEVLNRQSVKPGARKIAVLGDIAEIDGFKEDIYRDVAESVSASDADVLITYGTDSKMVHDHLSRQIEAWHESSFDGLCGRINSIKGKNDVFLFKASRSMNLEKAIKKTFPIAYAKGMLPVVLAYGKWTLKTL